MKKVKVISDFDEITKYQYESENVIPRGIRNFNKRFDEIITEGLERHGYRFTDKNHLIEFVKRNCEIKHFENRTSYYVKGREFLRELYPNMAELKTEIDIDGSVSVSSSFNAYFID